MEPWRVACAVVRNECEPTAHGIHFLCALQPTEYRAATERYPATNETDQPAHPSRDKHVVEQCATGHDNSVTDIDLAVRR